jgi:hypothetical protein
VTATRELVCDAAAHNRFPTDEEFRSALVADLTDVQRLTYDVIYYRPDCSTRQVIDRVRTHRPNLRSADVESALEALRDLWLVDASRDATFAMRWVVR